MRNRSKLLQLSSAAALLAVALSTAGCARQTSRLPPIEVWPDMDRQGKYLPQQESKFFADKRASRYPVAGTVARGFLKEDDAYVTGTSNGNYLGVNPEKIDAEFMKLGQMRYNTYCSPCHDRTGSGKGLVGAKSLWIASNLHEDRVRNMVDGEIFQVISAGRRSMPSYRYQITERDRWAIIAYVRALQRAAITSVEDVPQDLRTELR
jgi:mono/diheme cytochrome c family protein